MRNVPEFNLDGLNDFSELLHAKFEFTDCNYPNDTLSNYLNDNKKAQFTDAQYQTDYEYIYRIAQL